MLLYSLNKQQQLHNKHKCQTLLCTSSWLAVHTLHNKANSVTSYRFSHLTPKKAARTNVQMNSPLNSSALSSIPDLASEPVNQQQKTIIAVDSQPSAPVPSNSRNDDALFDDT